MIDAKQFARPHLTGDEDTGFHFGLVDKVNAAKNLRAFADAIERGEILLQVVQSGSVIADEDFLVYGLFLEYAYRQSPGI